MGVKTKAIVVPDEEVGFNPTGDQVNQAARKMGVPEEYFTARNVHRYLRRVPGGIELTFEILT